MAKNRKNKIRPVFVFSVLLAAAIVIAVIVASAQIAGYLPPDLIAVLENSAGVIFREWYEAEDALRGILRGGDGKPLPYQAECELYLDGERTGRENDLWATFVGNFGVEDDRIAQLTLQSSEGDSVTVRNDQKEKSGAFSVLEKHDGKAESELSFTYDERQSDARDLRQSGWNPAGNPDSPFDAKLFSILCDLFEVLDEDAHEDVDELARGTQQISDKLLELGTLSCRQIPESDGKKVAAVYENGDFAPIWEEVRHVCDENGTFRALVSAVAAAFSADGSDDLPVFFDRVSAYLAESELSFSGELDVFGGRIADVRVVLREKNKENGGAEKEYRIEVLPTYEEERSLLFRLTVSDCRDGIRDSAPAFTGELGYAVQETDGVLTFTVHAASSRRESGEDACAMLILRYGKDTGAFSLCATATGEPLIPGVLLPEDSEILRGKIGIQNDGITVSDTRLTVFEIQTADSPDGGIVIRKTGRVQDDALTFSLFPAKMPAKPTLTGTWDLFRAEDGQVRELMEKWEWAIGIVAD